MLARFSEVMYALLPLAWGLGAGRRPAMLGRYLDQLLLAALLAAAVLSLQLFYWHAMSGHWLAAGYAGGSLSWRRSHLLAGLLGSGQGWQLYLPLLALVGIGWLRRRVPAALAPVLGLLPALLWLASRELPLGPQSELDSALLLSAWPLLAMPLAALLAAAATRGGWVWASLRVLLGAGIVLTLGQIWWT